MIILRVRVLGVLLSGNTGGVRVLRVLLSGNTEG